MTRIRQVNGLHLCVLALGLTMAGAVHASDAREAFAACVSAKTSPGDDVVLARWLFLAMSEHPSIRGLVQVDGREGVAVDQGMAALFERLMTADCAEPLRALPLADLQPAFEVAFERLGQRAGAAIFDAPEVSVATERMVELIDMEAIEAIFVQAPE